MTTSPTPAPATAPRTHYAALELTPSATEAESTPAVLYALTPVRKAYRRLALAAHPDRCAAPDATARFQRIEHAYSVLSNRAARAKYDWELEDTCRLRRLESAAPPPWLPGGGGDAYGAAVVRAELDKAAAAARSGMSIPYLPFLALLNPALHSRIQADPSYAATYLASMARRDLFRR